MSGALSRRGGPGLDDLVLVAEDLARRVVAAVYLVVPLVVAGGLAGVVIAWRLTRAVERIADALERKDRPPEDSA